MEQIKPILFDIELKIPVLEINDLIQCILPPVGAVTYLRVKTAVLSRPGGSTWERFGKTDPANHLKYEDQVFEVLTTFFNEVASASNSSQIVMESRPNHSPDDDSRFDTRPDSDKYLKKSRAARVAKPSSKAELRMLNRSWLDIVETEEYKKRDCQASFLDVRLFSYSFRFTI